MAQLITSLAVVGDPKGIARHDAGRRQNRRVANTWRRTHLLEALSDKAQLAGIDVVRIDERGTSSTCPQCQQRCAKPRGRRFACRTCGHLGHRDIVGARNIAAEAADPRRLIPSSRTAEPAPCRPDVTDAAI